MKIRIKFKKYGVMKFIGHLDMMRYFQKAIRRSGIDIAYSTGFSPHQIMSFAAPLGVGVTSDGEYLDIEVNSTLSSAESLKALNDAMVEGVEVVDYRLLPDNAKTAMSIVSCSDYHVTYREGYEPAYTLDELKEKVVEFYEKPETIFITKKTKKSEKELDLKQLIYAFDVKEDDEHGIYFYIKVCTGSTDNVKPDLVMEHFYQFLGEELPEFALMVHRLDVYTGTKETGFVPLSEAGEVIHE